MSQANQRRMMTETVVVSKSSVFKLRLKVLNSSAEWQFQTEGALTLTALGDN